MRTAMVAKIQRDKAKQRHHDSSNSNSLTGNYESDINELVNFNARRKESTTQDIFPWYEMESQSNPSKSEKNIANWQILVSLAANHDLWSRFSTAINELKRIPEEKEQIFHQNEELFQIKLDRDTKVKIYTEFVKVTHGTSSLQIDEVAPLIRKLSLVKDCTSDIELTQYLRARIAAQACLKKKTIIRQGSGIDPNTSSGVSWVVVGAGAGGVGAGSGGAGAAGGGSDFAGLVRVVCELMRDAQLEAGRRRTLAQRLADLRRHFPIDPESRAKQGWDLFCMFLLLYCSFSVPFSIAFDDSPPLKPGQALPPLMSFEVFLNAIFLLDVCLSFLTCYDDKGYPVRDYRKIAVHYCKTWFIPDVAGSFPFDLVVGVAMAADGGSNSGSILQIIRFSRMLKLVRAVRFISRLNKLKQREGMQSFSIVISLFNAVFLIFFVAHLLGCIFIILITDPEHNWLVHYNADLMDAPVDVRYVTALYWAVVSLTTMGYGDVIPATHAERLFAILVALFGAVVFSYCLGTISTLIGQVAGVDERFQEKLRGILEYFQFRGVPMDIRRKVQSFYYLSWRKSGAPYRELDLLEDLNPALRNEMLAHLGSMLLSKLPILQGFKDELVGWLAIRMRRGDLQLGEVVYRRGDLAQEIYFVARGAVKIRYDGKVEEEITAASQMENGLNPNSDDNNAKLLEEESKSFVVKTGDLFGELSLLPCFLGRSAEWQHRVETATVVSNATLVYVISVDLLREAQRLYPVVLERFRDLCMLRAAHYRLYLRISGQCDRKGTAAQKHGFAPGRICLLKARSKRLKNEIISFQERQLLLTHGWSPDVEAQRVFIHRDSLFGVPDAKASAMAIDGNVGDDGGYPEWVEVTFVVGKEGSAQCFAHSTASLMEADLRCLGWLPTKGSAVRAVEVNFSDQPAEHSRGKGHPLYACAMRLYASAAAAKNADEVGAEGENGQGSERLVRTARAGMDVGSAQENSRKDVIVSTNSQEDCLDFVKAITTWQSWKLSSRISLSDTNDTCNHDGNCQVLKEVCQIDPGASSGAYADDEKGSGESAATVVASERPLPRLVESFAGSFKVAGGSSCSPDVAGIDLNFSLRAQAKDFCSDADEVSLDEICTPRSSASVQNKNCQDLPGDWPLDDEATARRRASCKFDCTHATIKSQDQGSHRELAQREDIRGPCGRIGCGHAAFPTAMPTVVVGDAGGPSEVAVLREEVARLRAILANISGLATSAQFPPPS